MMSRALLVLIVLVFAFPYAETSMLTKQLSASVNVQIIVDQSGSMAAMTDTGEYRIDSARTVLDEVVAQLPQSDNINVGLRVYGHLGTNQDSGKMESCQSTELIVPMAGVNKEALSESINTLQPVGWTPIGLALKEAEGDFSSPENVNTTNAIILLTDGLETCGEDPIAISSDLRSSDKQITTHVIGFGTTEEEQVVLQGIAESGGGDLYSSNNTGQLMSAIFQLLENLQVVEVSGDGRSEANAILLGRVGKSGDFEVVVTGQSQQPDGMSGGFNTTVELTITYVGPQVGNPGELLEIMATGESGIYYDSEQFGCDATDDQLERQLFTGGSMAASFCFTVHPEDADSLLLGITALDGSTQWFATSSEVPSEISGPIQSHTIEMHDDFTSTPNELLIPANVDVIIKVKNIGYAPHSFNLEGTNYQTGELKSDETATLVINLPPGTYFFKCDVLGHAQNGQTGVIVVAAD